MGRFKLISHELKETNSKTLYFCCFLVFDATAKLQSGILSGNLANLGFFDQCLEISAATSDGQINGKYCLGSVTTNFNFVSFLLSQLANKVIHFLCSQITIWSCLGVYASQILAKPRTSLPYFCSCSQIISIRRIYPCLSVQIYARPKNRHTHCSLLEQLLLCKLRTERKFPNAPKTICFSAILGVLVLIITISTALDVLKKSNDFSKTITAGFKCFSVLSNGQALFSPIKNEEQMSCLNGLKVISLFWIILLHEYSIFSAGPIENLRDLERVC